MQMPRRFKRQPWTIEKFWGCTIQGPRGCILWIASRCRDGYGSFNYRGKTVSAHRWIYDRVLGIPEGKHLLHSCDTPACVALQHLSPGTYTDNVRDAIKKKRRSPGPPPRDKRGSGNGRAKLTEQSVLEIRDRVARGERQADLAREYGVDRAVISTIVNRKAWSHVP